MALLRREVLLSTPLSLSEARSRLVAAMRLPGEEPGGAPLAGRVEGWDFELTLTAAARPGLVAVLGHLAEEAGQTRVALLLRPGRAALALVMAGMLVLSVTSALAAVLAIVASTRRGAPHWVGALGIVLPGLTGVGWLSAWDLGFQRAAARTVALLEEVLEGRELPLGAAA